MESTRDIGRRDLPLDFVKGLLVIVMVIYHIMNYFSTAGPDGFGYVRFVSGSFIFVSGFIISTFYEKKYRLDRMGTSRRLFIRGLKLLLIFTALNVLLNIVGIGNPRKAPLGIDQFLNNITEIYLWGNGRYAAFQILLPISYLLMLAPGFLLFNRYKIFLITTSLLLALCISLFNVQSDNIGLGIVGIIGLSAGMVVNGLERPYFMKNRVIIFCCLAICIYFMGYLDRNVMTYSLGVMLVLKMFYDLAKSLNLRQRINQVIILFGQYTLVCYIAQIAFLYGLLRLLPKHKWGLGYETISIFIVTNIFLWGLCLLLNYMRDRYKFADYTYRLVFS